MPKLNLKTADYCIITALIIAGLAGLWVNLQQGVGSRQKYALIYVDNQLVAEISLGENDRFQHMFPFGESGQYQAVIEAEEGKVRLLEMDADLCLRGICAHTGWIAHPYESIVCLPNRIMVVFREAAAEKDLDGVTF